MPKPPDTNPQPRSPAPQHDPVFIWPTPNTADYLFYVEKNGDLPKNKDFTYGDAYWDAVRYPNHKLVFVSPQTNEKWSRWFYASDRINQDEYNWSFVQADLGGVKFDGVERLYLYKRSEFLHPDTALATKQGDQMPNVPAGMMPHTTFLLSERVTQDAPAEELKSLYIVEKRTYFARSTIASVEHEQMLGIGQGSVITLYYRGETPSGAGAAIETLVNSPSNAYWSLQSDGTIRTGNQLSYRWFAVATASSLDAALNAYTQAFPIRIDLDLPKVLKSVNVVWSSSYSIGTQDTQALDYSSGTSGSVSLSIPDSASSAASIKADLQIVFEDFATNNLFAENRTFYMKAPITQATILAKLAGLYGVAVNTWPVFKPQSHTITISDQSINVRANVQVSLNESWSPSSNSYSWSKSVSDDFAIGADNKSVQLPPCIHPAIPLGGGTTMSQAVSATALMWLNSSNGAGVSATKTKSGTAYGVVSPSVIPATSGYTAIPTTGKWLIDMDVSQTQYASWFKINAVVFDATNLA